MNSEPDSDSDPGSGQSSDLSSETGSDQSSETGSDPYDSKFSSESGADPDDSAASLCLEIVRAVVCVVRAYALQITKAKTASPVILSDKAVS